MKRFMYGAAACVMIILVIWIWPPGTWLVPDCRLDGEFADWRGRTCLADDVSAESRPGGDFKQISWATNENDSHLYFMVERHISEPKNVKMECRLFFDVNGDGSYTNLIDKYAQIIYQPRNEERGDVEIYLYSIAGELQGKYGGRWGEGINDGASRFEFAIPMEDLQAYPAQPMRFYLADAAGNGDRLPDEGDVQWAPFPIVSKSRSSIALTCLIWLAVTVFLYRHKLWGFYYIWGSVGLCCVLVLLFHASFVEYRLESFTSLTLHKILGLFDIATYIFDRAPGTLLVLIKIDSSWTTMIIDIENSGLLEMCILFSLIIFYPVFKWRKRIAVALVGVLGIYLINLVRLVIVIVLIHAWGRNMSFVAHTLFGRLFFFLMAVALYWQLITRPSLDKIRRDIQND